MKKIFLSVLLLTGFHMQADDSFESINCLDRMQNIHDLADAPAEMKGDNLVGVCSSSVGNLVDPYGLAVTADGNCVIATSNYSKTVNSFPLTNCSISSNFLSYGSLGLNKGIPLATAVSNDLLTVAVYSNTSTASYLDIFNFDNTYHFTGSGKHHLAGSGPIQTIAFASTGSAPSPNSLALDIAFDKSLLALSNYPGNEIRLYSFVLGTGMLNETPLQIIPFQKPAAIRFSKDGQYLFVLSNNNINTSTEGLIGVYKFNGFEFIQMQPLASTQGKIPSTFAVSSNEEYIAVSNWFTNNVTIFRLDKLTGSLTLTQSVAINKPTCISFGPADDRLAVGTTTVLQVFKFNKTTGTVTTTPPPVTLTTGSLAAISYTSTGCLAVVKRFNSPIEVYNADCI